MGVLGGIKSFFGGLKSFIWIFFKRRKLGMLLIVLIGIAGAIRESILTLNAWPFIRAFLQAVMSGDSAINETVLWMVSNQPLTFWQYISSLADLAFGYLTLFLIIGLVWLFITKITATESWLTKAILVTLIIFLMNLVFMLALVPAEERAGLDGMIRLVPFHGTVTLYQHRDVILNPIMQTAEVVTGRNISNVSGNEIFQSNPFNLTSDNSTAANLTGGGLP